MLQDRLWHSDRVLQIKCCTSVSGVQSQQARRETHLGRSILSFQWATSRGSMWVCCQVKAVPHVVEGIDGVEDHRAQLIGHDQGNHAHEMRDLNLHVHAVYWKCRVLVWQRCCAWRKLVARDLRDGFVCCVGRRRFTSCLLVKAKCGRSWLQVLVCNL